MHIFTLQILKMQKNVLNNKIFSYNLEFYINFILKILRCDIMDNKTGILLLSHGSKLIDGAQVINAYKDMYIKKYPEAIVEVGYMEIRQPDIPAAFENLKVRADLDKVIVVPVFIANGVHTKRDIPKILGLDARIDEEKISSNHDHNHEHHHGHGHQPLPVQPLSLFLLLQLPPFHHNRRR